MIFDIRTILELRSVNPKLGDVVICSDAESPVTEGGTDQESIQSFRDFADACAVAHIPVLAQGVFARLLAFAYDGQVLPQPHKAESGKTTIYRLAPALEDPWCRTFPLEFPGESFRSDDIMQLPLLSIPLCNSELTQFQAFKIIGVPHYGVQWYAPDLHHSFIQFAHAYVYQKS
jgi:hypothetical protein